MQDIVERNGYRTNKQTTYCALFYYDCHFDGLAKEILGLEVKHLSPNQGYKKYSTFYLNIPNRKKIGAKFKVYYF